MTLFCVYLPLPSAFLLSSSPLWSWMVVVSASHNSCFLNKLLTHITRVSQNIKLPFPSFPSSSTLSFPLSPCLPSGLPSAPAGRRGGRSVQHRGLLHAEQQPSLLPGVHQEPQPVLEGRLRYQPVPRTGGERARASECFFKPVMLISQLIWNYYL